MFLNEDDARTLLLVRAVEQADRDGALLTQEDRAQASDAGRAAMGGGKRAGERYLAVRSRFAAARLETRQPAVPRMLRATRWPAWIGWLLPLIAFALGIAANELGNARRLDLLAAPLLGTFAWNVLVYLWIAATALRSARPGTGLPGLIARIGTPGTGSATPLSRALSGFLTDWHRAAAPLNAARASRTMHLSAATFALGLIAGIYLRALAVEYRAGWESTLLGAGEVHALLSLLLGPASAISGIAIPDVPGIAALRITGEGTAPGDARPWLHLFAVTAAWLVVLPRLLLAGFAAARALTRERKFPVPGREDFYIRKLLREAQGASGQVRVTPYAYTPGEAARARLTRLLTEAMGDGSKVQIDGPVSYGAEDDWLGRAALDPEQDLHIVLFSLSSTPEEENHGAFVKALDRKLLNAGTGTMPATIVDESPFRDRFGAQAGYDERLETRRAAWRKVIGAAGLTAFTIDLGEEHADDIQRIEALSAGDARLAGSAA